MCVRERESERERENMRDNFRPNMFDEQQCLCRTVVLWPVAPTDVKIM